MPRRWLTAALCASGRLTSRYTATSVPIRSHSFCAASAGESTTATRRATLGPSLQDCACSPCARQPQRTVYSKTCPMVTKPMTRAEVQAARCRFSYRGVEDRSIV
eukprot:scaffold33108_cov129-Isochrysis_galbana.AAC.6